MIRFTTPVQEFVFDIDPVANFARIVISYAQKGKILFEKEKSDLSFRQSEDGGEPMYIASFMLSQEETGLLSAQSPVAIQVRVLTYENEALASDIFNLSVDDVLKKEVLHAN